MNGIQYFITTLLTLYINYSTGQTLSGINYINTVQKQNNLNKIQTNSAFTIAHYYRQIRM